MSAFGTVGTDAELEAALMRAYWGQGFPLFDGGPTFELLELGGLHSNAWHLEPSCRSRYVELARSGSVPAPLELEDARRLSWSHLPVLPDGWHGTVFAELEGARALDAVSFAAHAALVVEVHGRSLEELLELRARPCRSGWSFDSDPDYLALFTINETKGGK